MRSKRTIIVTIAKARWRRVHSFAKSGPDDRHYVVETAGDKMTVEFGDGLHGAVPRSGATMEASYSSESSGASGNTVTVTIRATFGKVRDRASEPESASAAKRSAFQGKAADQRSP